MKGKVTPTKSTTKAYVSFCFSLSVVVSPNLYRFFIDSETNETIPLHFRNVFHFFSEENSLSKPFLVECVRSGGEAALQAAIKGGNFGAKLTHLCGF